MAPGIVWARYRRPILLLALVVIFAATFDPEVNRWFVNFTWLAALGIWAGIVWRSDGPSPASRLKGKYVWPFLLFVPVFAAVWLPFYDNWRWVQAGDTIGWYGLPEAAARYGLPRSLLSVHGIGDLFTYTQLMVDNFLMFIFEPTFFWHRASNFTISVLALLAIYTFFSLHLEYLWPLAIVVTTAATFNWQNISHISFNHIDSFIYAYGALTALTLVLRDPSRRSRWLGLGLVAGLSLFFTQTAWAEVTACALVLGPWALYKRHYLPLGICALSFLVAGLPMLLQFPGLLHQATTQTQVLWDWGYVSTIFRLILMLPVGRDWGAVDWNGAFAGWPSGQFYIAGLIVAALCIVPAVRLRLRLPAAVVGLLFLFLAEAVLMTITNNANSNPSPKRTYHLIPLQAFFGLLPFYTVAVAVRSRPLLYRSAAAAAFAAVLAYTLASASLFVYPERFRFGGNVIDGIVQMRQRFSDRKVLVFAPQESFKTALEDPAGIFNQGYHVAETVSVTRTIDPSVVDAACTAQVILCYCMQPENREQFERAASGRKLRKIDVYATVELQCFECM